MKNIQIAFLFLTILIQISCQSKKLKMVIENSSLENPTELKEPKKYILKKKFINSDFAYSKLKNIDKYNKLECFEPTDGDFIFYQLIAAFKGFKYVAPGDSGANYKIFNDILIIKTNEANQILDAYQFTLEWSEMPLQQDVYKSKSENIILSDSLDIKLLKLNKTEYWDENNKESNDNGIIILK